MSSFIQQFDRLQIRQIILPSGTATDLPITFANDTTKGFYFDVDLDQIIAVGLSSGITFPLTPAQVEPISTVISGTNIDWSITYTYRQTLSANTTFTFSNAADGMTIIVALTNTASNWTVTWPTVSWPGGTPPVQTTGAHTDVYTFVKMGSTIFGSVVQNF